MSSSSTLAERGAAGEHTHVSDTANLGNEEYHKPLPLENMTALDQEEHTAVDIDKEKAGQAIHEGTPDDPSSIVYPSGLTLTAITIGLCLSIFCMAIDNTIIAVAIPKITDQFHSIDDIGWLGSAYLLTTCAFQLFFGKLYSFFNIKWTYIIAIGLFELGSLICGAAPTITALIVGRAVAGIGAAGIFSGAVLIINNTVPLAKRPLFMGTVGGMYGIASVAGPLMGGAFTDHLSWRWCFYINLPMGAVTVAFITLFYHPTKQATGHNETFKQMSWKRRAQVFDMIGTVIFLPMIVCLLLALQWGGSTYPWHNGRIIALLVLFGVLLVGFIFHQLRAQDNATIPPRILLQRTVRSTAWFASCLGAAFFVFVYFLPIWFQAIKGVTALKSGIMSIPLILSLVLMSLVAGGIVQKFGYYLPLMILSSVLMTIGAGVLSTFTPTTGHSKWIGFQVIFGAGVGSGMQQGLLAVQTVLPQKDIAIGTSIIMFCQTLGGALFISIAQNIFSNTLLRNIKKIVPDLDPSTIINAGATNIKNAVDTKDYSGVLTAYNGAVVSTFYVAVAMSALSLLGSSLVEWKSVKGDKKKTEEDVPA